YLSKKAPAGYATRDELVMGYEEIREKITAQLPRLFGRLPKAPFEIRTIEEFRERSAPSQYWSATPDGSRPGVFYVNAAGISKNNPGVLPSRYFSTKPCPDITYKYHCSASKNPCLDSGASAATLLSSRGGHFTRKVSAPSLDFTPSRISISAVSTRN